MLATYNLPLIAPKGEMTGDNAAMIGVAAFFHIQRNNTGKWSEVEVNSSAELVK
jgi:tRNA A37 threonylcarbamoyltransferase TsaD